MLDADVSDLGAIGSYPALDDATATLEARARAYLHVNCAICHRPDGPSRTDLDFRYDVALADTNACDALPEHGDLGVADARVIAPEPARSLVSLRMRRRDADQMPPMASNVVDEAGAQVVDEWISSLSLHLTPRPFPFPFPCLALAPALPLPPVIGR
ncbi:MAG: hypothetical protein R3F59_16120 [Myxococcota bacterium]